MSERLTGGDQGRWDMRYRAYVGVVFGLAYRYKLMLALVGLGLATRLPLLSISLDEVDAAAYCNALKYGYNISEVHPHPPGNPVYVFMAGLLNVPLQDPLLSLTLLSALFGSIAVVPFNLLLKELGLPRAAVLAGSLFFIFNPLLWAYSEAALSDVPAMFFAITLAYLCFRARRSDAAFLAAAIVASLLLGVRTAYNPLLVLLCFPIVYRLVRYRATGVIRLFLAPSATDPPTGQPKIPADSCQPGPREFPAAYSLAIPRIAAPADGHRGPCAAMKTVRRPPYPKWNPGYFPCSSLTPLPLSSRRPSVSFGGFGFSHRRAGHVFVLLWLMCVIYPIMHIVLISATE